MTFAVLQTILNQWKCYLLSSLFRLQLDTTIPAAIPLQFVFPDVAKAAIRLNESMSDVFLQREGEPENGWCERIKAC